MLKGPAWSKTALALPTPLFTLPSLFNHGNGGCIEGGQMCFAQVHLPLLPTPFSGSADESVNWEPWSGNLVLSQTAMGRAAVAPRGLQLEVCGPDSHLLKIATPS